MKILFTEDEEFNGFSDVEWDREVSKIANQELACWSYELVMLILPFQPPTDALCYCAAEKLLSSYVIISDTYWACCSIFYCYNLPLRTVDLASFANMENETCQKIKREATLTAWTAFEQHPSAVGSYRGESWCRSSGWGGRRCQSAERSTLPSVQPFGWKTSAGGDTDTWQHRTSKLISPCLVFFFSKKFKFTFTNLISDLRAATTAWESCTILPVDDTLSLVLT